MIKHCPYRNIFVYYRGASTSQSLVDNQLEDNITKAFINLLEYSDRSVLQDFLNMIGIIASVDNVFFDIQVSSNESRPDALIRINGVDIYIESKFDAPFNEKQLQKHIKNAKGYILYISKQKYTKELIQSYNNKEVIFINWIDITKFVMSLIEKEIYNDNTITNFLLTQYLGYMEELNIIPFIDWKNRDFEAFLTSENENPKVMENERKRVKEKLGQFISEMLENLKRKSDFYGNSKLHFGNLDKEHVWSAIKFTNGKLIDQVHISFIIQAFDLSLGLQIEGVNPTKKAIEKIKNNREIFLKKLKKLQGFIYIIRERFQIQASIWDSKVTAQIVIDEKISEDDINYIIRKIDQYEKVELRIVKMYDKQDAINKGREFMQESINNILMLEDMISFLK